MTRPFRPVSGSVWSRSGSGWSRSGAGRARSRDRRVYLGSHPVLFVLLAATRRRPVRRLGRTVLVHDSAAYRAALTTVPLDRTAAGTTGGEAGRLAGPDTLFDQHGPSHRRGRREVADRLGIAGIDRLRPLWTDLLDRRLAALAPVRSASRSAFDSRSFFGAAPAALTSPTPFWVGPSTAPGSDIFRPFSTGRRSASDSRSTVELVRLVTELAGITAAALLELTVDPLELATAARAAAATAARAQLPGLFRNDRPATVAADRLLALVGSPRSAVLAVAAINTTVAALPRAAAWAADADLWEHAATRPRALADEMLRVTAATPLLPRVPAAPATLLPDGGGPVRPGDRMLLIARHAADAHRRDPDPAHPAPAQQAQLVFGAGPHACPGAALARAQMTDFLAALAPYRPRVVRARADRRAALPGWSVLTVRGTA